MDGIETKSGRKVQRPAQFNPVEQTPTRKRRATSKRFYDSRICQVCQRGQSPATNMIVFCDGCNTPYHQLCHDPPIDNLVVTVVEAQWLCNLCDVRRVDKSVQTGESGESINDEDVSSIISCDISIHESLALNSNQLANLTEENLSSFTAVVVPRRLAILLRKEDSFSTFLPSKYQGTCCENQEFHVRYQFSNLKNTNYAFNTYHAEYINRCVGL